MSLERHDVSVYLGVNNTQLAAGLGHSESYIEHFGQKMVGKLNRLLGVSVFHTALHLVEELLPSFQEIWDGIYGVDEKQGERLEKAREGLHKLREAVLASAERSEKAQKEYEFSRMGRTEKLNVLMERQLELNRKLEAAQDILGQTAPGLPSMFDRLRYKADKKLSEDVIGGILTGEKISQADINAAFARVKEFDKRMEDRAKFIEDQAHAQIDLKNLEVERLQILKQQNELEEKGAREVLKRHDAERKAAADREKHIAAIKSNLAGQDREFMPTLDELANSGQWMRTRFGSRKWWQPGRFAGAAQGIQDLEGDIKADVIEGLGIDPFKRDRLQSLRDQLSKAGVYQDPQHEANERLKELVDAATGKGINVIPQMEE